MAANYSRYVSKVAVFSVLVTLLLGCEKTEFPQRFNSTDITGANFARDFSLLDQKGRLRTLADFRGKVVVVFFGYTHCPDFCPATLSEFKSISQKMGESADEIRFVFVTLDPERDTPPKLETYLKAFDPKFVGLTGSIDDVSTIAKEFKVIFQRVETTKPGRYSVDHSTGTFVFDKLGRIRLFVPYGKPAEEILEDLQILLNE